MKKAMLTGASGFIGSHLKRRLEAEGWTTASLGRESDITREMSDFAPDIVFHLASLFLASHQQADIPRLIESNVLFGTRVLEAMSAANVRRLINTGTAWQYFEDAAIPVNLYAATKTAFDAIIDYYASAHRIGAISLRLFDTYGDNDTRTKLVHLLMKVAKSGEHLGMSKGEQRINIVHVDDVVSAFAVAANRLMGADGRVGAHEKFVVSSPSTPTLKELVAIFERSTKTKLDVGWGERPYREREVMLPYSKGSVLPGWTPKVKLEDGLRSCFRESHHK